MNYTTKRKLNNLGVSLVELIIVVSIMAVLAGGISLGVGAISGKPAQKASNQWMTALERVRTVGMGKSSSSLTMKITDSGLSCYETINGSNMNETKLGPKSVSCKIVIGTNEYSLSSGDYVICSFDRADGSLKSIVRNDTSIFGGGLTSNEVLFYFEKAGKVYKVTIVPMTGRVTCVKV